MTRSLTSVGRALVAFPFVVFGIMHFYTGAQMAPAIPGWLPWGVAWVYITGLGLVVGGLALFTTRFGRFGALILALLLVSFIVFLHIPGLTRPETAPMATTSLLKDTTMLGAVITWFALIPPARPERLGPA